VGNTPDSKKISFQEQVRVQNTQDLQGLIFLLQLDKMENLSSSLLKQSI
jgi:hypothetical protein